MSYSRGIALELLRFATLLTLVSIVSSGMAMWIADSSFLGFFENLHLDRDGVSIWKNFWTSAIRSAPILLVAVALIVAGALVLGSLMQRSSWGWVKVPVLAVSAMPSFLFPFLPTMILTQWRFEGLADGGIIIPAICLAVGDCNLSSVTAQFRESLRTQRSMPHVQTIEALGLSVWRFVLPRASVSMLSALAGRVPHLIGGLVALELLYNIRGLGVTAYQAVESTPADLHWLFWIGVFCVVLRTLFRWLEILARYRWMPETLGTFMSGRDRSQAGTMADDSGDSELNDAGFQNTSWEDTDEIDFSDLAVDNDDAKGSVTGSPSLFRSAFRNLHYYLRSRPSHFVNVALATIVGGIFVSLVVACWSYGDRPDSMAMLDPSDEHWFGTDLAGLDVLSAMRRGVGQMVLPMLLALLMSACMVPAALFALFRWMRPGRSRRIVRSLDAGFQMIAEGIESLPKLIVLLAFFSVVAGQLIDQTWFGVSVSFNTMVLRLFAVIGLLHAPQVYRAVRDELSLLNQVQFLEAALLTRLSWRQLFFKTVLRNHCLHILFIQAAVVAAGVLHYDAVLGLLGVRGRGVIFTWGSNLGMGVEAYMQYAPLDWFNAWILAIPLMFVWVGIVALWILAESLKILSGGYVYRIR